MSKLTSKKGLLAGILLVLTLCFLATASPDKVAAQSNMTNCPNNGDNKPDNWGINTGATTHGFSSLTVVAHVKDNPAYKLNVKYKLNSRLPTHDQSGPINYGPPTTGQNGQQVPAHLWPHARIFKVNSNFINNQSEIEPDGRMDNRWFGTGGAAGDSIQATPDQAPYNCTGWDQLGPGNTAQRGNGFVLDCQEIDTKGIYRSTYFWISEITNPTGQIGEYGGRWIVRVSKNGSSFTTVTNDFANDPMSPNDGKSLNVINGVNARINLEWVPNGPPPPPPNPENDCTFTRVTGSKLNRRKVEVSRISGGDKFYDGNPDGTHGGNINAWVPSPPGEEVNGEHTKRWNYKPKDRTIHIKITQSEWKDNTADGVANPHWVDSVLRDDDVVCYDATCDLSVVGNVSGRPNGVRTGGDFTVNAHVHNRANGPNTTPLFAQVDGRPLILANNDGTPVGFWYNPGAPDGLHKGGHSWQSWNVREPGWSINNYGLGAKLYYDFNGAPGVQGDDLVLADCAPTSYDVYKPFNLSASPEVRLAPTMEDPTQATFIGHANTSFYDPYYPSGFNVGFTVDPTQDRYIGPVNHYDGGPKNGSGRVNTPYTYGPINPQPNSAGDKYCLYFDVHQDQGLIGPNNWFAEESNSQGGTTHCLTIHDRPYMHAYGADVISGSEFVDRGVCTNTGNTAGITTYRSPDPTKGGSGAQFAALALGQISEFPSASARTFAPTTPKGLSFSNTIGDYGGSLAGSAGTCAQDFVSTLNPERALNFPSATVGAGGLNASLTDERQSVITIPNAADALRINGAQSINKKAALFVDGDVVINGNISQDFGKYFALIVRGDIYIDNDVSQLDGLYVAQPRDATNGGRIYTCANDKTKVDDQSLYTQCRRQLRINGAFVARAVEFLRSYKSLRDSIPREPYSRVCDPGTQTCSAEVFNFSPDIYLNTPTFESPSARPIYDSIKTLPPVL